MEWARPSSELKNSDDIPNNKALKYSLSLLDNKNHCIDAGAHIGTVSRTLSENFVHVHSFEPLWGEYLKQNISDKDNVTVYETGLGFEKKTENIYIMPTNTGGSSIVEHEKRAKFQKQEWTQTKEITIKKIDSFTFNSKIDFIKIDVESYEWHVLKGAENTLKKHKPLIMIELLQRYEDKKYTVQKTQDLLKEYGYVLKKRFGDDFIYGYR